MIWVLEVGCLTETDHNTKHAPIPTPVSCLPVLSHFSASQKNLDTKTSLSKAHLFFHLYRWIEVADGQGNQRKQIHLGDIKFFSLLHGYRVKNRHNLNHNVYSFHRSNI